MALPRHLRRALLPSFVFACLALLDPSAAQCDVTPLTLTLSNITVTQDGVGVTRGIELGIGSPHQVFAFRPSTTLNNTRINNQLNCGSAGASNNSCIGSLGGGFDPLKSETYAVSIRSQWNGSAVDDEDSTGAYVYFNDDVGFQSQGDVDGFPLVMHSEEFGGEQSRLPLGTNSSFLRAAVAGGVAPSEVFGLWPGSRGINPRDGMLVVGGYDKARIDPSSNFTRFPVGQWSLEQACPLQVTIKNLKFADQTLMNASDGELHACIEPSAQRFFFPPAIASRFASITNQNSTLYPKGMHYNVSSRPTGDLQIELSNGYQTTIPNEELFAPLRGSDKNGRYAIVNDTTVEAFIADNRDKNPSDVEVTIGAIFLTFNYLMVDYAKGEFNLAKAVTASTDEVPPDPSTVCIPSETPSSTPEPESSGSGTNVGAIAGGVVGGMVGLALLAGLAFIFIRRRRRAQQPQQPETAPSLGYNAPSVQSPASEMAVNEEAVHELATSRHASVRKQRVELDNGNVYT